MAKKSSSWNTTCKRFVAFFDILGFKDMVLRHSHEEVYEMLKSFSSAIAVLDYDMQFISPGAVVRIITKPVVFSDSIILISNDDSMDSALNILSDAGSIIINAIKRKIPIKGAIAHGEQTADLKKSIHFGRPLIDAFELQNELQLYGVVLHYTMEKHLVETGNIAICEYDSIFKYPVPMKNGKIIHYIVDWLSLSEGEVNWIESVSQLYKDISGNPRLYVDNTVDCVRLLITRKEEREKKIKP